MDDTGHGGHYAEDGPSAKRFVSGKELNLDPEIASFITANCSPFTHPTAMDVNPKVVDTKVRALTAYAYLECRFQTSVANINSSGEQLIIMNANPLAALPIVYSKNGQDGFQTDPAVWASRYEENDMGNFLAQCKTLGTVSKKHRIVGAGLRVKPTTSVAVNNRGLMEAGHITVEETQQVLNAPFYPATGTSSGGRYWTEAFPASDDHNNQVAGGYAYPIDAGYLGQALMQDKVENMRLCIENAKSSDRIGRTNADDGISVRWLPTDNWDFVKTVNHHVVGITDHFYGHGDPCGIEADSTSSTAITSGTSYISDSNTSRIISHPGYAKQLQNGVSQSSGTRPDPNVNLWSICPHFAPRLSNTAAGSVSSAATSETRCCTYQKRLNWNDGETSPPENTWAHQAIFYAVDTEQYKYDMCHVGNVAGMGYMDDAQNFQNAMYVDITGVPTDTKIDVTCVWHVEFIPKEFHLNPGRSSPVSLDWFFLEAMISDPQKFPLVVQGNSFFTSLWKGVKKAARFGSKFASVAAPVLSAMPDPRAQAAGMALGTGAGIANQLFG